MAVLECRPCPFCGGEAVVAATFSGNGYVVKCHGLGCHVAPQTDGFDTAEAAVACWNGPEGENPVGLIGPSNGNKSRLIVCGKAYDVTLTSHTSDYHHIYFSGAARTIENHRFVFESRTIQD